MTLAPIPKTWWISKVAWKIAEKWWKFASELWKIPAVWRLVEALARWTGRAIAWWTQWAISTAKYDILAKWWIDKNDIEDWVKFGAILWAGWPILESLWKNIFWITIRPNTEQAKKMIQAEINWWKLKDTIPSTALERWLKEGMYNLNGG